MNRKRDLRALFVLVVVLLAGLLLCGWAVYAKASTTESATTPESALPGRVFVIPVDGTIDQIAFCPHGPDDDCDCRKPKPGMLINAADYLAGSPDLISIRSRGTFSRPFTRVHEIQREAEESYRSTADELTAQLQATEQKLTELQQLKTGEDKKVLSPEQEQAVDEFLAQKLAIRKSLREVQHQLTRDIEALGTRLKLINIGLIPLLLTLLVLGLALAGRSPAATVDLSHPIDDGGAPYY